MIIWTARNFVKGDHDYVETGEFLMEAQIWSPKIKKFDDQIIYSIDWKLKLERSGLKRIQSMYAHSSQNDSLYPSPTEDNTMESYLFSCMCKLQCPRYE